MINEFILINNLILISITLTLFWLLTFIYFYKNFSYNTFDKSKLFECGFTSLNTEFLKVKLNNLISLVMVLLYEFELILALPFSLLYFQNGQTLITFMFIIICIVFTLYLDLTRNIIKWVY